MITISNTPLDMQTLKNEYYNSRIHSQILSALEYQAAQINYSSIDEVKFEVNLRAAMVESSIRLSQSNMGFAVFRKSFCNNKFWRRTRNGGFLLLQNVKPSAAIQDIYQNGHLYATECSTAMVIVLYGALLSVFQENGFNRVFSNIYLMNWHSLDRKIAEFGYLRPTTYYLPGDRRYFYNPDVTPNNPEWQGENAIQLAPDRFYAHDFGIVSGNQIISFLNDARKNNATRAAFLKDTVGRPNFDYLYRLQNQLYI